MDPNTLLWLIPLFPLLGFLINAFLGANLTKSPKPVVEEGPLPSAAHAAVVEEEPDYDMDNAVVASHDEPDAHDDHGGHGHGFHLSPSGTRTVGGIATLAIVASFVVALICFLNIRNLSGEERRLFAEGWSWMAAPGGGNGDSLDIRFKLMLDPLSSLMTLIITGIGALIHLYSTAYMSHDKGYARYFTYLNLFVFFMLILVMGANLPVMFVGWEGVGLASYLLIGFWYERKSATDAAKKAFIVNRIGDCALLIAMFLIYKYFGTLDFYGVDPKHPGFLQQIPTDWYRSPDITLLFVPAALVPLLLFFGAAGKSAQIPLYVWLPDAMEGPTPVSALIHAATMVTGGVYLISRTHELFLMSPEVMMFVAIIGLATAFLAATIGLVQNDIKRVLAYSTVSQLGYMFLACGVGAFGTAMFHVTTHAFFKALLFLGSGSVIHAMSGEQDMRKMGGLKSRIKTTYATMLIGTIAISGIPPLAGFWSKDEILLNAFGGVGGGPILWGIGVLVSAMTAFYMFRLMGKTFEGKARYSEEVSKHVHESSPAMTVPLMILAVLSIFGGVLGINIGSFHFTPLDTFLGETVNWREKAGQPLHVDLEMVLMGISAVVAIVVSVATYMAYTGKPSGELRPESAKQRDPIWRFLYDKWRVDELYQHIFVRPGYDLARWLWRFLDSRGVGGVVNGTGSMIAGLANTIKGWQSGYVRNYAFSMLVGVVFVVIFCLIGLGLVR